MGSAVGGSGAAVEAIQGEMDDPEVDLRLAPSEVDEMLIMAAAGRTARRLQLPTEEELVRGLHEAGLVLDREAVSPRKQLLEAEGAPQTDVESSIILAAFRPA